MGITNLFYGIIRVTNRHWKASLLVLLALIAGCLAIISKISIEDDITALIPVSEDSRRMQEVLRSITFTDKVVVMIRRDSSVTVGDLVSYAGRYLDSLESGNREYIRNIQGKLAVDDLPGMLDMIRNNLPVFLDTTDYARIASKLNADSIADIVAGNYRNLVAPTGLVTGRTQMADPMGLTFTALEKLRQLGFNGEFTVADGFLLDAGRSTILLFITPKYSSNEIDQNKPFTEALYALPGKLKGEFGDSISVQYYGAALAAVANASQIRRDILFTAGTAMVVLLIILILFYRKVSLPFLLFAPTVFGVLIAIAFLCLIRVRISALSLGIGSVLLGVTLDFALHVMTHIRNGSSWKDLARNVAPAVMTSSTTTASAFLCLLFLKSQALQDLGIFAAVSVLAASAFALVFIPQAYRPGAGAGNRITVLDRIAGYDLHRNRWALLVLGVLVAVSTFTYRSVSFNQDIRKLNYEGELLEKARAQLELLTDIESGSLYLAAYGDDLETVLSLNDSIYSELQGLQNQDSIRGFTSLGALVRSKATQSRRIADWEKFWDDGTVARTEELLVAAGGKYGFKPSAYREFYDLIRRDFEPRPPEAFDAFTSFSIEDYLARGEGEFTVTSLVRANPDEMNLVRKHFGNRNNILVIDRQEVNESFLGTLRNDFNRLIGFSLVVVLLILALFYRSLSLTLVTSIPIFLTWFLTIGIMGILHLEFNIFNIIICSFIFGLGVDYCIFVTNGLLAGYRTGQRVLPTHKVSILLSVITTIAGVGVLIFARHPVLHSIASLSLVGILSALLVSFLVQPLLFRLFIGGKDRGPATLRYLLHSLVSFVLFGIGGLLLSAYARIRLGRSPKAYREPNLGFHRVLSGVKWAVMHTNPFFTKDVRNPAGEDFKRPAMIISNHTSFLDSLCIGMLNPRIVFLVNDWVYHSPVFGSAARMAGAYPVSKGLEDGEEYLREKVAQGFSLAAFPEGTRSTGNKIKRFHKGSFYLAEKFGLDILPIIIHGNAEGLPKGSFIIRDGRLTVEILPRIAPTDLRFGADYSRRARGIGRYFRSEFRRLRSEVETSGYWKRVILENYRYCGDALYRRMARELKTNSPAYREMLSNLGERERVTCIVDDTGLTALYMVLDSGYREVVACIRDPEARAVLANNNLARRYGKLMLVSTATAALDGAPEVVVTGTGVATDPDLMSVFNDFNIRFQNDTFIVFNRK